jgi:hypothetical protein
MVKILLYIKHKLPVIWKLIEWFNGLIFCVLYGKKMRNTIHQVCTEFSGKEFKGRRLIQTDLPALASLIAVQAPERLTYFQPHGFDVKSLLQVLRNPAFLMMGVFDGPLLVGYFFLRCFWNRKCFVGRLIDEPFEHKGIGRMMNDIMYNIGWRTGFRVLSTISKNNHRIMKSHAHNPAMVVLKELDNEYLLVEFINR